MISAHYARLVHREFSIRKLDEKALFDGCDVTPEGLWQISKLDPRDFLRLLDNARRIVGEVPLGTLISSRNRLATLGMMGTAMMSAPTLGDGVQAMSSFSTLEADYLHFQLSPGPLSTRIALETDRDLGSSLLLHAETVFLLLQDYLLDLVGNAAGRIHFRVADNAPPHSGALEAVLQGPLSFNCRFTGLEFPTEWLAIRSPYSNPEVWQLSRRHLGEQLQASTQPGDRPYTRHLRSLLQAQRPPLPDIGDIAESLHLSPRTLSRRLMEEQTTFRELKLHAAHNYAKGMLLEGASVEAIAAELGYENAANFRRSFRALNQCSPKAWVARYHSGEAELSRAGP